MENIFQSHKIQATMGVFAKVDKAEASPLLEEYLFKGSYLIPGFTAYQIFLLNIYELK